MNSWTVIIPTIWCGVELEMMLPLLVASNAISEIIIINNNADKTPAWFKPDPKIRMLDYGFNILVNPAWNIAVEQSKNQLICLLSDDVLLDVAVFDWLKDQFPGGPVCYAESIPNPNRHPKYKDRDVIPVATAFSIQPTAKIPWRFGCVMFFDKQHWIPIHPDLLIYFGDCWLFETYIKQDQKPRLIHGAKFMTRERSSSGRYDGESKSTQLQNIVERELWQYKISQEIQKNQIQPVSWAPDQIQRRLLHVMNLIEKNHITIT